MAILFCDGFDHYGTAHITKKWSGFDDATGQISIFGAGRAQLVGTAGALRVQCTGVSDARVWRDLGGSYADLALGFALWTNKGGPQTRFLQVGLSGSPQFYLKVGSDLRLELLDSDKNVLTSSSNTFLQERWQYVEVDVSYTSACNGNVTVRVDETDWISGSYTVASKGGGWDLVELQDSSAASGYNQFDDLYVTDGSLLGNLYIEGIHPYGEGTFSEWTPSGSDPNYVHVNESAPDDDNTYVAASAAGKRDSYDYQNIASLLGSASIAAVAAWYYTRLETSGSASLVPLVVDGAGSTYSGSSLAVTSTSYLYSGHFWEQNPATGAAWEPSELDTSEFGMQS